MTTVYCVWKGCRNNVEDLTGNSLCKRTNIFLDALPMDRIVQCAHFELKREHMRKKTKCPYCPKEYQSINDLGRHLMRIHGVSNITINDKGS